MATVMNVDKITSAVLNPVTVVDGMKDGPGRRSDEFSLRPDFRCSANGKMAAMPPIGT